MAEYFFNNGGTSGGSGGLVQLAPDTSYFTGSSNNSGSNASIIGIDASAGLTTALSLTGKHAIGNLGFNSVTAENVTIELTVDGVEIINDTFALGTTSINVLNTVNGASGSTLNPYTVGAILCEQSLVLRIATATDSSVNLFYLARPIL